MIINRNSIRQNLARHLKEEDLLKMYVCPVVGGACVVERSHSSLLSVVSCRSRLNCVDSSGRCAVPAGVKCEAADSLGHGVDRQSVQQHSRAEIMDASSAICG